MRGRGELASSYVCSPGVPEPPLAHSASAMCPLGKQVPGGQPYARFSHDQTCRPTARQMPIMSARLWKSEMSAKYTNAINAEGEP